MNKKTEVALKVAAFVLGGISALGSTGCGFKADLWGAKFEMPQGFDVRMGLNEVNDVDDHRGVKPTGRLAKNDRY